MQNTATNTTNQHTRIQLLDTLRGIAVVLMIVFHFCYDLTNFGYSNFDMFSNIYWEAFRAVIVGLFTFCVGYSFHLSHKNDSTYINLKKLSTISARLFASACLVSIATYFMFADEWIFFGILHFIFVSYVLLALVYWCKSIYLFALSLVLFLTNAFGLIDGNFIVHFAVEYLNAPHKTLDMVAFAPWFCVVLVGLICARADLLSKIKTNKLDDIFSKSGVNFLGRHALFIYLIHQVIMFGLFSLTAFLINL